MYQIIIKIILVVSIISGLIGYYIYNQEIIKNLKTDLSISQNNEQRLIDSLAEQKNSILLIENQYKKEKQKLAILNNDLSKANQDIDKLRLKLIKHNLSMLSLRKPGLIENIINKGTSAAFKDIETITKN